MTYFFPTFIITLFVGLAVLLAICEFTSTARPVAVAVTKPTPLLLQLRDGCFYRKDVALGKELVRENSLACLSEHELKSVSRADVSLTTATKIHEARQLYTDRVELFELMK